MPAWNAGFDEHTVSAGEALNQRAGLVDCPGNLVAEHERRFDGADPVIDVNIRATDA
jgi:hypothetical protein